MKNEKVSVYNEEKNKPLYKGNIMARIYQRHSSTFKAKVALNALRKEKTLSELSQEYSITPTQVSAWKKQLEESSSEIFDSKQSKNQQAEIDRLHQVIDRLTMERDFLDRALSR